ncbi:MAG: hypothetical protein IKP62_02725 [Salinivirgaceae bacterium]|nr:hypothetical protein [Salinivirgaceae bacterium]
MNTESIINDLSQRANVMTFRYLEKTIVLYDDHRWILNVLFSLKEGGFWGDKTPNIIYFDKHDDAAKLFPNTIDIIKQYNRKEQKSLRDFLTLVEFDLNPYDGDWVTAGMELELIDNVVCIGTDFKYNRNISIWDNNIYETQNGIEHKGFCINHLKSEIGYQGIIGDTEKYNQDVRDIFGYKGENAELKPDNPYVLDFDLDCFTTECRDKTFAWPKGIFKNEYADDKNLSLSHFIQNLKSNASIITICREPNCCGGLGESNKILGYLDTYFFEGALGTTPIEL